MSDNVLAQMSERVLDMSDTLQAHLAIVRKMDQKTDKIVAELPRLRWVAYGAILLSLANASIVGWLLYRLRSLLP